MSYRKKLIEVSLPLDAINAASAREKSIRHGHPSTLHLWWARRPLAACRAVLFAQLVDDPSSCEDEFPTVEEQDRERDRLHGIIEAMVPWEATTNETTLHAARYEIARSVARNGGRALPAEWKGQAHAAKVIDYLQQHAPPVHDPFSGGGSIPLEAQRLGLRASGSDLNPVAVLIGKALVEFPPKFADLAPVNPEADRHKSWKGAQGLADDVRYYGRWLRDEARRRIGHHYPELVQPSGRKDKVIAWLWARTVASPDPQAEGKQVPLAASFVLSTKKGREAIVVPVVDQQRLDWRFEVIARPEYDLFQKASSGTVNRQGAICILTGTPIPFAYIRTEAKAGRMGARLMAIVTEADNGRAYHTPTESHERIVYNIAVPTADGVDQDIPDKALGFRIQEYGIRKWSELYSPRQLSLLCTLTELVESTKQKLMDDAKVSGSTFPSDETSSLEDGGEGPRAYADAVATYIGLGISKLSDAQSTLVRWKPSMDQAIATFARQALPMVWDYAESNPFSEMAGDLSTTLRNMCRVLDGAYTASCGVIKAADASKNHFPIGTTFSTDPPYYDNIGYADLSDYFYVWLRRGLGATHPSLFRRLLVPKSEELIATPFRHGGREGAEAFFMRGMSSAIKGLEQATSDVPTTIYYAFKQSEASEDGVTSAGWATFLQAVVDTGLLIDGTWPMRSEMGNRMVASGTNALASSIVLVCRKRGATAEAITRADFLRHLRAEMPGALSKIRAAGVGPTDIQQAAIGPGIGIFTRHSAVLNPDGSVMPVRDALKLVNQVREELASEAHGDYDAPTRFAIDWFIVHGHKPARSGDAITMANAIGLGLADLERAGIFRTGEGKAELMERSNLKGDWSPGTDRYPTAWEACQHLIRRLESAEGGIDAAAALFAELGDLAEPAHRLAFRLYDICNNKGWAAEAQPYNNLIQEWPVIEERSRAFAPKPPAQGEMAI